MNRTALITAQALLCAVVLAAPVLLFTAHATLSSVPEPPERGRLAADRAGIDANASDVPDPTTPAVAPKPEVGGTAPVLVSGTKGPARGIIICGPRPRL